ELYINDGAYGTLFDAAHIGWKYPVQLLREPESDARDMDFAFWGPTCDDLDYMAGPFPLPADTNTGDYFEIGMLGAYGQAMRTGFNGFGTGDTVVVTDEPMLSVYAEDRLVAEQRAGNVVKL
ncbi:MAG: type III PLP-dependent enzyme, partial [Sphingomonadaceae bacterium]